MATSLGLNRAGKGHALISLGFDRFFLWSAAIVALAMVLRTYALIADPYAPLSGGSRDETPQVRAPYLSAECQKGALTC